MKRKFDVFSEDANLNPPKKRKITVEKSNNRIVKYEDSGEIVEKQTLTYEEYISSLIKKQGPNFFRESISKEVENRLPVFIPPHFYGQESSAKKKVERNLLTKPMKFLEDTIIEGEKLRTVSKEFSKNYAFKKFRKESNCTDSELNAIKMKSLKNVLSILNKGIEELSSRRKNIHKRFETLTKLQKKWLVKRKNESNNSQFKNKVKGGDLFIDLSFNEKCLQPAMLFGRNDKIDIVLLQSITYGQKPYIIQNDMDENDVLQMAQESIFQQEIFKFFVKSVLEGKDGKYVVAKNTAFEMVLQIAPFVFFAMKLQKITHSKLPFWEINVFQNIVTGESSKRFCELIKCLLKESLIMAYKEIKKQKTNIFDHEIQAKSYSRFFIEVVSFLQHLWYCRGFIRDCEKQKLYCDVENFIYPSTTYMEVGENKNMVHIKGIEIFIEGIIYHSATAHDVKHLLYRNNFKKN